MKLVVALLGFALLAGGGAAIAGTGVLSPKQEREAFLDDAAKQLGVTPSELTPAKLRAALEDGKTLAQVAKDQGKSVDGLVQAMLAEKMRRLDQAVKDGRLTKAERNDLAVGLKQRVTDLVNGRFPSRRHHEFRDRRGAALLFPTA